MFVLLTVPKVTLTTRTIGLTPLCTPQHRLPNLNAMAFLLHPPPTTLVYPPTPLPYVLNPVWLRLWTTQETAARLILFATLTKRQNFRQLLAYLGILLAGSKDINLPVICKEPTTPLPVHFGRMPCFPTTIPVEVVPKPLNLNLFILLLLTAHVYLYLNSLILNPRVFKFTLLLGPNFI